MEALSPTIHSVTEGGVAATHTPLPAPRGLVAPTTSPKEHNTLRDALVPFACWRAHDLRFRFDSSFILPELRHEIKSLKSLIDRHTRKDEQGQTSAKPVLSVFGHADPVGSDDYNKLLSGRRAQAIYALLVRNAELWDDLYNHPLGNDKWEPEVIHAMQTELHQPLSDHPAAAARHALYLSYMDRVCTIRDELDQPLLDASGQPVQLKLVPTDFLAGGADERGGKGDYQGCGEFNPILIFSDQQNQASSAPEAKEARDAANAPNRRVVIFLFRPGVRIKPQYWPCPPAKEGVAGCRKRFWSDGERRRGKRLPDQERTFEGSQDTFACRFYDRLANRSPCEKRPILLVIRLVNLDFEPIAGMPYRLSVGDGVFSGTTTSDGLIQHLVPPDTTAATLTCDDFTREVTIEPMDDSATVDGAQPRLLNLAFGTADAAQGVLDEATQLTLKRFQTRHELTASGKLDNATAAKLKERYGS